MSTGCAGVDRAREAAGDVATAAEGASAWRYQPGIAAVKAVHVLDIKRHRSRIKCAESEHLIDANSIDCASPCLALSSAGGEVIVALPKRNAYDGRSA